MLSACSSRYLGVRPGSDRSSGSGRRAPDRLVLGRDLRGERGVERDRIAKLRVPRCGLTTLSIDKTEVERNGGRVLRMQLLQAFVDRDCGRGIRGRVENGQVEQCRLKRRVDEERLLIGE